MNKIKAQFTEWTKGKNWVSGTVGPYQFESKLFDKGSIFGIKEGRVSKLSICDPKEKNFIKSCVVNYDRGWDIKPSKEVKPYYNAVMELLENAPTDRFND